MHTNTRPAWSPVILACLFSAVATVTAQEALLKWVPSKAVSKFGYFSPKRLALKPAKPDGVKKTPDGLASPLYGEIILGPKESPQKITVLVDESPDGAQRLWIDGNGNGDLTDDPAVPWIDRPSVHNGQEETVFGGYGTLHINYGSEKRDMEIFLFRLDPKTRPEAKDMLQYYRQWGWAGELVLEGKAYKAMLDDPDATGDFRGIADDRKESGIRLLVDVDGDGRFASRDESFDVIKPFNILGNTYEITGLTASGSGLKVVIKRTKSGPLIAAGTKTVSFEAKTTTGETVKFPDDYKGKLVLLDFWATWCGPCRVELPNLKKVYEDFHGKGFEILGVSLDSGATVEKLGTFTTDNGMSWPQICDGKAWDAELAQKYNVTAIPAAFLVNGNTGTIVALGDELRGTGLRPAVEKGLASLGVAKSAEAPNPAPARPAVIDPLIAKAEAAQKEGKLMEHARFLEQRKSPVPVPVALSPASSKPLSSREVARIAREAHLRAGWFYHCTRCDKWHVVLGGAYAIAPNVIVTGWHVMTPPDTLTEGFPVAVDSAQNLVPITGVIASDARMDAIVMRAAGNNLKVLPLGEAEVGDAAFCFSDPLQQRNYFSAGIVNRFHAVDDNGTKPAAAADAASLRMNVSTDWAPGSSGAAILDGFGNIIGHVATMVPLFERPPGAVPANGAPQKEDRFHGAALMTLHDAIPATSILSLIKPAR